MEICSRFTGMERKDGAFLLHTDNANVKVCFVTDEIVRVRASFDHELAEESYVLMTTAWEDRIKLLPDAALYRSTRIHHTPDSYTKRELVGAGPPSILLRKTVRSLKSPTGAFIAALRFANANLSGRAPPSCLRKTVLSLKSPTGAFIAPLRCANANLSGRAPPSCCARPFCRLKAPLGLSLLRCAAQTRTFENTSLSAVCKKKTRETLAKRERAGQCQPS